MLDPKFALEEVDADNVDGAGEKVTSLKKLLMQKRNRGGYDTEGAGAIYNQCSFMEFLESMEPHDYLATYNKFVLDEESKKAIANIKHVSDLEEICSDLKVCGRREMSELLKIRYKYSVAKIPKEEEPEEAPKELTTE